MTEWVPFRRDLVNTHEQIWKLLVRMAQSDEIGLDTESSGPNLYEKSEGGKTMLNVHRSTLTGISLAFPDGYSCYIPVEHKRGDENAPLGGVARVIEALRNTRTVWIHNLDHELHTLSRPPVHGRMTRFLLDSLRRDALAGNRVRWRCTLLLSWLLNASKTGSYGLKKLAPELLGLEMGKFSEVSQGRDFSQLRPKDGLDYACEDAEAALRLGRMLYPELQKDERLLRWYEDVELPFVWLLNEMEGNGILFDPSAHSSTVDYLRQKQDGLLREWDALGLTYPELEKTYKRVVGPPRLCRLPMSPFSSKQLQALFDEGIWPTEDVERTKTGWSTKREVVEELMEACEPGSLGFRAASLRTRLTGTSKLLGTYGEKLYGMAGDHADGRIRDSFRQAGTRTGRLSSSLLLLVPKHSEDGKRIRESFRAEEGTVLLAGDYSQIELRVLAHFARCGALYDAFLRGNADPHQATADAVGRTRQVGKTLNFAMVYGAGPGKVAAATGMSHEEAEVVLAEMNERMAAEVGTLDRAEAAGLDNGCVRTLGGRFRPVFLRQALYRKRALYKEGKRWTDVSDTYRKACRRVGREKRIARNTPIQGGAGDIMKVAALRYWRTVDRSRARVLVQIHDDLVSEVDEQYLQEATEIKREAMRGAWELRVPLEVDIRSGKRWSDL